MTVLSVGICLTMSACTPIAVVICGGGGIRFRTVSFLATSDSCNGRYQGGKRTFSLEMTFYPEPVVALIRRVLFAATGLMSLRLL